MSGWWFFAGFGIGAFAGVLTAMGAHAVYLAKGTEP